MLGLTKLALKRPVTIFMAVLTLLVFGLGTIFTTPMELMPDIEMPMMIVMTTYAGAAPQDVEDQVTSVIEDAASTLNGVKTVESMSMENASIVMLEMEYGTDMDEAHSDLSNNIEMYKSQLPDDAGDPTIVEMSMDMMPILTLSVAATGDVDLKYYVEEEIQPEIEKIGGVASVSVYGGVSDYIKVSLREDKMSQYHLNMNSLAGVIGSADFSLPAGSIAQGSLDMTLRGGVKYDTLESLRAMPITLSSGDTIALSDVADVYYAKEEQDSLSFYNGLENVTMSISKRQSASTISTVKSVLKTVDEINAANMGVKIDVINDTSESIIDSVVSVLETLLLGVVLAMAVLFIFLGEWKASLIVGASIPLSLLITMLAMSFMGFSYNILSLGGLVIGVGMMVDNSIVVIESCFRIKTKTASYYDAALEGTKTVIASIFGGTLTTVVVFLPMALVEGLSGQLFGQLCFTIVFSLTASLFAAITVVPLVFYKLKPVEKEGGVVMRFMDRLSSAYTSFMPKTFRRKRLVVIISVLAFAGSVALVPFIGVELIPESDDGIIEIAVDMRPGTKLDKINTVLAPLEEMVRSHPDVDRYSMTSGGSGLSVLMGDNSSASITAYLKDDRSMKTKELVDVWLDEVGDTVDYNISITSTSSTTSSMGGSSDIQVLLKGSDFDDLKVAAKQVKEMMLQNPYFSHVTTNVESGNPQAEVIIDPVKASARGLVPKSVMGNIYYIMEGIDAGDITQSGRDYEVRVEYPNDRFENVSDLASLTITNTAGADIPLLDIASIEYSNSPLTILRSDGSYYVQITGQPRSSAPKELSDTIQAQAKTLDFPKGVEVAQNSQDEQIVEEFTVLLTAIASAVFLVFVVMAMQFESPVFSGVVMVSIPFALIGSFLCLFVFDCTLSMPSLMGFLMLVGSVVNNGILLIDSANAMREERGLSAENAVLTAGVLRMRPIFMTTLTTILAMVPMAVGIGSNAAMMRGMALVIIGGLTASTALTLLLIPTFYLLTDKRERQRRRAERKAKKEAKKA